MRYTTTDELEHFSFAEAYIADVQAGRRIFPYDTFKRDDIAGEFLQPGYPRDARERSGVKDQGAGDPVPGAGGGTRSTTPTARCCGPARDEVIDQAAWNETIRSFADGTLYALKAGRGELCI